MREFARFMHLAAAEAYHYTHLTTRDHSKLGYYWKCRSEELVAYARG